MKKIISNEKLFFCDFDSNQFFKPRCILKYFEKYRFAIADEIGIYDYFELEENEIITFPVIKVSLDYKKLIKADNKDVQVVSTLDVPIGGILKFHQSIWQDNELMVEAVVDVAALSNKKGVLFKIEDNLKNRIIEYLSKDDEVENVGY